LPAKAAGFRILAEAGTFARAPAFDFRKNEIRFAGRIKQFCVCRVFPHEIFRRENKKARRKAFSALAASPCGGAKKSGEL